MGLFSKNRGWQCENTEDGQRICRRFEVDKNQKLATGTEVSLVQDPNTCEVVISGDTNTMMDEDWKDLDMITNRMKGNCRKGIR